MQNTQDIYDVIIVGLGVMGSSCYYHINKLGYKVLGIEQFTCPNQIGSSGGETRCVRSVYYEDKELAQMAKESIVMWKDFQKQTTKLVYKESLGVIFGPEGSFMLKNSNKIDNVKTVDTKTLREQFGNVFQFPDGTGKQQNQNLQIQAGVIDSTGGIGYPTNAIEAFIECGQRYNKNSRIIEQCRFIKYEIQEKEKLKIFTDMGIFYSKKIILSLGIWLTQFNNQLQIPYIPLEIQKQTKYWFKTNKKQNEIPWFFSEINGQFIYSLPQDDQIKISLHRVGPNIINPYNQTPQGSDNFEAQFRNFFSTYIPELKNSQIIKKHCCSYTMTNDENFIIDFLPNSTDVIIMSPCSGHGFKFSILLGKIVANMLVTEKIQIEQFRIKRLQSKL